MDCAELRLVCLGSLPNLLAHPWLLQHPEWIDDWGNLYDGVKYSYWKWQLCSGLKTGELVKNQFSLLANQ